MKHFKILLPIVFITSTYYYSVHAEQSSKSLYSYVMETYDEQSVDTSAAIERLSILQEEYKVALHNNLHADSLDVMKEYAKEVENKLYSKIDASVASLQENQSEIAVEIESGLYDLTPMELSILNRQYSKYQEEINDLLEDRTSIVALYDNISYERIDTTELESGIKEQQSIISGNGDATYIGSLNNFRRPFDGPVVITSNAGYRTDPIDGKIRYHNATDYAMVVGTNLYSIFNGVVVRSDNNGDGYGENIKIDCGNGIILHYAHLSKRYVEVGDVVKQNQLIGLSGNTGRSTGPHLHMGLEYNGTVLSIEELYK